MTFQRILIPLRLFNQSVAETSSVLCCRKSTGLLKVFDRGLEDAGLGTVSIVSQPRF